MLFKREITRNLKSFFVATAVCTFMAMYIVSMAPSFGADIQKILDMKLPAQLQQAMGLNTLDYARPESFFSMVFTYIYLFLGIYAAGLFASIVSKEYSDKTAEYLYTLPAKKSRLITTKLLVASLFTVLSVAVTLLGSVLAFQFFIKGGYNLTPVLLMSLAWLIGGLFFGSLSFLISSFFVKSKTASIISIGAVMIAYVMQVVISMNDKLSWLTYLSPFDWFKGPDIQRYNELDPAYTLIAIAASVLFVVIGIRRFKRMDVLI